MSLESGVIPTHFFPSSELNIIVTGPGRPNVHASSPLLINLKRGATPLMPSDAGGVQVLPSSIDQASPMYSPLPVLKIQYRRRFDSRTSPASLGPSLPIQDHGFS